MQKRTRSNIIISYITQRRLIGITGILLPFVCITGGFLFSGTAVQESVSYYYYTNMRDFFTGLMSVVSVFLITYKGYGDMDDIVSTLTGIAGFGICLFPCMHSSAGSQPIGILQINPALSETLHVSAAAVFFILLAFNSIFLFTRSEHPKSDYTPGKSRRNKVYILCGSAIIASLALLVILTVFLGPDRVENYKIPMILEIIMLTAFGTSWLVKGETIFRDQQDFTAGA